MIMMDQQNLFCIQRRQVYSMGLDSCNLKGKMKSCNIAGGNIYPTGPKGEQGKSLEFDWKGTSLGVRTEGQEEFVYKNLQGPKGENGVDALVTHKYQLKITSAVTAGTEVTIPCYYKVGQAVLDVYLNGERLLLSSDDAGTDGHYQEVGTANSISNKIKTTTDWALEAEDVLDFVVRGDYSAT